MAMAAAAVSGLATNVQQLVQQVCNLPQVVGQLPAAIDSAGGLSAWMLLVKSLKELECGNFAGASQFAKAICDCCREQFYAVHWKDVDICWRQLYTYARCVEAVAMIAQNQPRDAIRACDMALLMGAPCRTNIVQDLLTFALAELNNHELPLAAFSSIKAPLPPRHPRATSIPRIQCPSLTDFLQNHMQICTPVIIEGAIEHWPALRGPKKWQPSYLNKVMGYRTIPVEVGSRYTDAQWTQKLMTMNEFLNRYYVGNPQDGVGYLAQHDLFAQVPELRADFDVPEYCYLSSAPDNDSADHEEDVTINVWIGPAGTISPLHTDPYHNMFAQVEGSKYIRLHPPSATNCLYPHMDTLLKNTSQVDVDELQEDMHPNYLQAACMDCVIKSGELLYIPPYWWHYVKSLEPSISCSFWWQHTEMESS